MQVEGSVRVLAWRVLGLGSIPHSASGMQDHEDRSRGEI